MDRIYSNILNSQNTSIIPARNNNNNFMNKPINTFLSKDIIMTIIDRQLNFFLLLHQLNF